MVRYESNRREVQARLKTARETMLTAMGIAGRGYIKLVTPVDTGALRGSIQYKSDDKKVQYGSTLTSEDYPVYVEKGTRKMKAQPYIEPGIMLNLGSLRNIARRHYKP